MDTDDFDLDDMTVVDEGGAVPAREISDDITRPHETEPGVLQVLAKGEPPANSEWVLGFQRGVAAAKADDRRAIIAEAMARGAPRAAAEELAGAVLRRAAGEP